MARKVYDLAIKVGDYVNKDGIEKGKWINVGVLMKNNDGRHFILLDRTFNPAGVINRDGQQSVIISCFEPRDNRFDNSYKTNEKQTSKRTAEPPKPVDLEDEIPF